MIKQSFITGLVACLLLIQSAYAISEQTKRESLQSIYTGCVKQGERKGRDTSLTKQQCQCAIDVLANNLNNSDWDSFLEFAATGKPPFEHPKMQSLMPQFRKCKNPGSASANDFPTGAELAESVYNGCIDEARANNNLTDETRQSCRCATDVFTDNLSEADWLSVINHFQQGKAFDTHPRIIELMPAVQACKK